MSRTILPASGSTGTVLYALSGTVTITKSPVAASAVVPAVAFGPRSAARASRLSGPRELLITTS